MDPLRIMGWNTRRLRVERALTIEDLADAAGVSPNFLGQVERGARNVSVRVAGSIAQALGVPIDQLFAALPPGGTAPKPLRSGPRARAPSKDRRGSIKPD